MAAAGERAQALAGSGDDDRLSNLPDCLLQSILSRLTSRQVVRTSVLARRWRDLWRSTPRIDIDQREFRAIGPQRQLEKFEDFADNLMALHGPPSAPLGSFRIHYSERVFHDCIWRWVRRALARRPAALEICYVGTARVDLPLLRVPRAAAGRLKSLHLHGLNLNSGSAGQLSALGVLEDLHLSRCRFDTFHRIASASLKDLIVDDCNFVGYNNLLELAAPRLASLRIANRVRRHKDGMRVTSANAMPFLERASVRYMDPYNMFGLCLRDPVVKVKRLDFLRSLNNLFRYLTSVTNLELSGFPQMALVDDESKKFPTFHNLKSLLLRECNLTDNFQLMSKFLGNARNLEKIALHNCKIPSVSKKRKRGKKTGSKMAEAPSTSSNLIKLTESEYGLDDSLQLADTLLKISKDHPQGFVILVKCKTA